jgi:biopolymer transport protein ExbD
VGGVIREDVASGDDQISAINVTSLVDVMFCLLIMFMVATPLMGKELVALPVARGIEMTVEELETQMVIVDGQQRIFIGPLPLDADRARWQEQIQANEVFKSTKTAFLQADETVPMETIVDVMAALKGAGVEEVGFVTDPRVSKKKP